MTERRIPASVTALLACSAAASLLIVNAAPAHAVPSSVKALLATSVPAGVLLVNEPTPFESDAEIALHRERQQEVTADSEAIYAKAGAEKRDLTEAEQKQVEDNVAEFDRLERTINARGRFLAQGASLRGGRGRQTEPDDTGAPPANRHEPEGGGRGRVEPRVNTTRNNGGFRSFGDFAESVKNHVLNRHTDNRLSNAAASTFGSEGTGADGGFAVPPDFANEISVKVFAEDSLIGRCDAMPTTTNSKTLPVDMTTPWDSSGGIQAYWDGEARAMTQSKPKLEEETFKAHKLHCLVPVTEELLEDAPAMDAYLRRKAPEKMDFAISNAIVRGSGAGMPLGFMNSAALVTQAAEAGQAADTIVALNISRMWSRMPVSSRMSAIWLIHPDAEPLLDVMTVGQQPVYMPAGGLSESPYGRLKGRPVIPHQVCETVGDLGDIMLVDLKQYLALKKIGGGRDANGFKAETSIHLWFDQDLTAFKFTFRLGGQPWWSKATDPRDGSNTQSPFVTLAAR
jgi:HK97 family phage major capsid protein